jgi:hypothetical protein
MSDPSQALQALLQAAQAPASLLPSTSRYYGLNMPTMQTADGRTIIYLDRRFIPSADNFALLQYHVVTQGERLDNITAEYLNDPTQFWRICDANNAMRPEELTETVGRQLLITLPQGIPSSPNA